MGKADYSTQVLVIGAGAAGSVYAARLAEAGKQVLVVEMGPQWQAEDLVSSQLWARRLKWGGPPVLPGGKDFVAHNSGSGWGTGGAALHHYATWPRLHPEVFRQHSEHGRGRDWPFDYAELAPWYDKVQAFVGVSGDATREPWRGPGAPYPMPPVPVFAQGELLADGFKRLDKTVAPLPLAINTKPYAGRPACLYDGWCDAGCPIGALANPLFTYLPLARRHGTEILHNTAALELLTDRRGRVTGARCVQQGKSLVCSADVVVVAGSIVQTPRLLLASTSAAHPAGLGNRHDRVGRHLSVETMIGTYGLFRQRTDNHLGVNAGQLTYRETFRDPGRDGVDGGLQWQIAPAVKPNDLFGIAATRPDLMGDALHAFIDRGSRHLASMVGFGGCLGRSENRIELTSQRDSAGMPLPRMTHSFTQEARALWDYMARQGKTVMQAAGATEDWTSRMNTGHMVGGTLLGDHPENSVTDGYGRVHEHSNLWLAGGGLIPACNGASPTFTIHALAERGAAELVKNWSDYAANR